MSPPPGTVEVKHSAGPTFVKRKQRSTPSTIQAVLCLGSPSQVRKRFGRGNRPRPAVTVVKDTSQRRRQATNATRQKPISTAMISDLLILEYPFSLCPFYLHKKGGGQVEMKHPGSQSALLLFGHAFQGDFPRPVHTRSAPCGSSCHLISFHLHFNVN